MIQRVEAGRELSQAALVQLGKSLPDLIDQGVTVFHVDTSSVAEFDSLTLEALLEFEALAKSRGLRVLIDRPSSVLYQALYMTGIAERMEVRVDGMGAGSASPGSASSGSDSSPGSDSLKGGTKSPEGDDGTIKT